MINFVVYALLSGGCSVLNIIIVGCGKVGGEIAEHLNDEGDNITVIDIDAAKVNTLTARLDVLGVTGNGATHLVQQEVKISLDVPHFF